MKREISVCDKCGKEEELKNRSESTFWNITLSANKEYYPSPYSVEYHVSGKNTLNVCEDCLKELGFKVEKKVKENPEYKAPTLEDVIREIVRNEIENN